MALAPGTAFGPYEITGKLGAGGMSVVWRATDTRLGREVALKLLPDDFADDPERRARFEREAKLLASLNHPNIAILYGLEHYDSQHVLVMEVVDGEDLAERIAHGPIPIDEAIPIAVQIAEALEAAHEQGIVHRDLKPANVRVRPDGTVKVLDFGLAKERLAEGSDASASLSPTLTAHATAAGVILGTAAYMSPEQARGKGADRRADIWAFGVVLWEMLSGQRLFAGETVSDVLAAVLTRDPDLAALPTATPASVRRLLARCLEREPKNRLQWIGDARLDLAAPPIEAEPEAAKVSASVASRLLPWVAAAVVAVAAVVFFSILESPARDARVLEFAIHPPQDTVFHLEGLGPGPVALSPDGSRAAYSVRDRDGVIRLCVRRLDAMEARIVPETEGAQYPFWSPDGTEIGFFSRSSASLRVIPADGGPGRTLCISRNGKGGTWNQEGTIVFTPDSDTPIFAVSSAGGEPRQLTELDRSRGDNSHRHPWFLPDGRRFLYTARSVRGADANRVMVGSLDGDEDREVFKSPVGVQFVAGHLLYLRGTTLVARQFDAKNLTFSGDEIQLAEGMMIIGGASKSVFSATPDMLAFQRGEYETLSELVWLDRKGNRLGRLGDVASYYSLAVSPDGSKVAVPVTDDTVGTHDLWIYDVDRDLRSRVTFDDAEDLTPVWSPDSRVVYFSSNRDGPFAVYRLVPGESGEPELVFRGEQPYFPAAISPDGSTLILSGVGETTGSDLTLLDIAGTRELEVFRGTKFNEEHAAFSPDGRWIAYTSDESGRFEVYVSRSSGEGRHSQLSTDGGLWPRWVAGTGEVVFQDASFRFVAVPVHAEGSEIEFGIPEILFGGLPSTRLYQHFDLPRDGSRILYRALSNESPPDPPTIVLNWRKQVGIE